jgi:hypothetical protein
MSICKSCEKEKCFFRGSLNLECPQYKAKPQTNADRIRAMSDEELEVFLVNVDLDKAGSPFITEWGKWLKQPVEGEM